MTERDIHIRIKGGLPSDSQKGKEMKEGYHRSEGWAPIGGSTKWHYWRNEHSICKKFMRFMHPAEGYETQDNFGSKQNCAGCERARKKELEKRVDPLPLA